MDVSSPILHLRKYCPALVSVAGAAEQVAAQELGNLPMPAAYVIPLSQDAESNTSMNGLWQTVTETFAVMICFDNRIDNGRGQSTSTDSFGSMTSALRSALLNWRPDDRAIKGLQFEGANIVSQDRARAWYRWVYSYEYVITAEDGWQPPSEDLQSVEFGITGGLGGQVDFNP